MLNERLTEPVTDHCQRGYRFSVSVSIACSFFKCCFTSTETVGTIREGEPRTAARVPGEIKRSRDLKRREVELDPHFCPEEIMSREVELG